MLPVLETTTSRDGTPIGFWRSGKGPALVLVHGASADHTRWEAVRPLLEPHVTVYAVDRRGRGASGDAAAYTLDDEAADVAAVVDAVASSTGEQVDLFGHSYGGICALEAALLTRGIRRLVLYESNVGAPTPPGFVDGLAALLADGRREEVVVTLLRDLAGLDEHQLALVRSAPSWSGRVAAAHTVVRELRAHDAYRYDPGRFAALTAPSLLLGGSESPPEGVASTAMLAATLPGARVVTLQGQGHVAQLTAPELFAAALLRFLRDD